MKCQTYHKAEWDDELKDARESLVSYSRPFSPDFSADEDILDANFFLEGNQLFALEINAVALTLIVKPSKKHLKGLKKALSEALNKP